MTDERRLARFVRDLSHDQIPAAVATDVKRIVLAVAGTAIAGAAEDGCQPLRRMLVERGGKPEATVLITGDRLPAPSAALLNGVMCRALDFCDAMAPGLHIGASLVPAALAAAELVGGCDGRAFVTALTAGAELAARMNRTEAGYHGFDPTGVAGMFGATAAAARILDLDHDQMLNALALAFNRCGGSFQSNVDGSLAVRLIQGWVAEAGLTCALLARHGLTGPANFLGGVYGYRHLFGTGESSGAEVAAGLGQAWHLQRAVFKKYPSCGVTQGVTELALGLVAEAGLTAGQVARAVVRLPPYAYRLVGHPFVIGANPRVNAQFSARFCVANAIVRGASRLGHFRDQAIRDPAVLALVERVEVVADPAMDARGHAAVDLTVTTSDGRGLARGLDIPPGFPGNSLSDDDHRARFEQCLDYAEFTVPGPQARELVETIERLDDVADARALVRLLVVAKES